MSSVTVILPLERTRYWRDSDGSIAMAKRQEEVLTVTLDYTDQLDTSETISSSTWNDDGVTTSSRANTTTQTSCLVSGTGGWSENTVVTSTGRTLLRRVRFYTPQNQDPQRDYRGWP